MVEILPFPRSDDPSDIIALRQQAAVRAMDATQDNPDDTARAVQLSKFTGAPPSLVQQDRDYFEEETKKGLTASLIRDNPYLSQYVNGHPLAASMSNDDWGPLSTLADAMKKLGGPRLTAVGQVFDKAQQVFDGAGAVYHKGLEEATQQAEEARKSSLMTVGLDEAFRKAHPEASAVYDFFRATPLGSAAAWSMENFGGPMGLLAMQLGSMTGFAHGATTEGLQQLGFQKSTAEGVARDLASVVESEAAGLTGRGHPGEPAAGLVRQLRNDIVARETEHAMTLAKPYIDAGQPPPKGLHPLIDQAHAIWSQIEGEQIEEAAKAAQKTNTWQRDKEFQREQFLSLFPNSHIEIPAAEALKLYPPGSRAEPEDGVLGWVPNINDQLQAALNSGRDVEIPRDQWITHADPEIRKQLADVARWRPGGMNKEEIEAALKPQETVERPPPTELDSVRNVAHLPDEVDRLTPTQVRGLDFRNHIPEGTENDVAVRMRSLDGQERFVVTPTHTFQLRDILPKLQRNELRPEGRVLAEFIGGQLDRLAGDLKVHVISKDDMDMLKKRKDSTTAGFYDPVDNTIVFRSDTVDGTQPSFWTHEVVMHEAAHAITVNAMHKFPPFGDHIRSLMNIAQDAITKTKGGIEFIGSTNAFKNEREFIAEALSNENLQQALHHIPVPENVAKRLRITANTMWEAVRQIVKDLWTRISGKIPPESVMDSIFRAVQASEDINKALEAERVRTTYGRPEQMEKQPELPQAGTTRMEDRELFGPKALGMSQKVYNTLRDLAMKRRGEDDAFRQKMAERDEAERQGKDWKDNEADIREMVRDHIMHLPNIAADHFLRTGELFGAKYRRTRLDGRFVGDTTGLDPEHFNEGQGIKPDAIANVLGFQSGDQMVRSLKDLKAQRDVEGLTPTAHINQMVEAMVEREMQAHFGKLKENILEAAKEHVFGSTQYDILHEHTIRLAEQAGKEISLQKDDIKSMARTEFGYLRTGRIDSTRLMEAVGRIGRTIEGLEATGKWDEAFKLSQDREIQFQQARMAIKAEKTIAKFQRRGAQFRAREGGIKSVGLDWSNAIQDIFVRAGVKVNRTPEDIVNEYVKTGAGSLAEFVDSKSLSNIFEQDPNSPQANQGSLSVASFLLDPSWRAEGGWKALKWDDFEALHNSIDSLYVNGRKENQVNLGGVVREREQLITDLVDLMHEVFKTDDKGPRKVDQKSVMGTLWSGLIQMETLWTRLAKGDPDNPFLKVINMPTMEAGNFISTLERNYSQLFNQIGKPPEDVNKAVENHLFFEPNERKGEVPDQPRQMTMRNLLAVLQNVGNWSNMDKLQRGYDIKGANIEMVKKTGYQMWMNDPIMNWLFHHTTKEDWDRAQKLGDLFEKLFSHSEQIYYDLGARPGPRIELRPIETPFGTYKGWYHPIIYDPQRPAFWRIDEETGERQKVGGSEAIAGRNPFEEGGFHSTAPSAGYQKGRTGYAAPLQLNFDSVPFRIKQMINDIAMRPVVGELHKIFSDSRFQTAMSKTYGPQYTKLLIPYLKDIAGQRRYQDSLSATAGKIGEYIYQNLVSTLIGFNPGTVLKHFPTALQNSATEVGVKDFGKEFLNTWLNPLGWKNAGFAYSKSDEVQRRSRNWQETLTGANAEMFGSQDSGKFDKVRQFMIKAGATPVAMSDLASVIPMWNVVYKREMREHGEEGQAIAAADYAVRRAHGSTATTARPAMMRSAVGRVASPFYTFFNDMLQRQYETAWRAKDAVGYLKDGEYKTGIKEMGKVSLGLWSYIIWPAIVEQAISPIHWKESDDNYIKQGAEIIGRDVASSWPIIRDLVGAAFSGQDPTVSIYGTGARAVADVVRDIQKGEVALDRKHAGKTIKHTATLIGTATGLVNSQMGRWGEFAHDYATGKQDPRSAGDWYRALRFGQIKEPKR